MLQMYDGEIVGVDLPAAVELTVTETEPGRAGRPGVGRPQAGHAGDRAVGPGPAVRQHRRPGQGRHPHRRVPDPGRQPDGRPCALPSTRREAARAGPLAALRGRGQGGGPVRACSTSCPVAPDPFVVDLVRGRRGPTGPRSTSSSPATPSTGRWTACRSSTGPCCAWPPTSCWPGPTCRPAAVISEAVELAKQYSTEESGRFVNGVLATIAAILPPDEQPCG